MIESRSPQAPGDLVLRVPEAGPRAVVAAVERARAAQRAWAADAPARSAALTAAAAAVEAAAEELARLVVREVGKPVTEARGEVARSVAILRYYAQQVFDPTGAVHEGAGPGLLFTRRRPRGVAGLITPWNFPLAIPLWKAAPALAFGNAVVLKPAPEATACAARLDELIGGLLPDGLFSVVPGDAAEGEALAGTADVVSFTGSVAVGKAVAGAAAARGVPVQAEMGGQNPAVVLPDADVERAAAQIAAAAMGYAGQKCTATKRVIAVGPAAGDVADALVAAVEKLAVGDPAHPDTVVGPVVSAAARERVLASTEGGRVLSGGRAVAGEGHFVAPTVVADAPEGHVLAHEEVFGPVCLVQRAPDAETALALANGVRFGLVSAVHTRDLDAALRLGARLETGMVKVNAPTAGVDFHLPFGGEKDSSYGPREQGKAAQEFYTSSHTFTLAPGV
ncbi:aldehyde dehydrogenase family protein [Streptomyces cinnamoneus]|uniref:aldehyde dehydrogenase family protein n=1 Tax=Streptomyces cinnamoneus TaxID=53446 RepID=UPI000CEE3C26|nr:aldehyde dehydrogenase family protein [Streptomyces cinnamoneus]PPT11482.1 aldehyde dehydrogenase [Streptomyces cinnamoneus]